MNSAESVPALTRRTFISRAALGTAAVAFAPQVGAAELPPPKLGIAILGLGGYASGQLAPALKLTQNVQITGVITGTPEKGRNWSQVFGFPEKAIYSYDTMARIADNPTIDLVYVVTPNALHREHVIAAAKAGKHVICEKPMAINAQEGQEMIAACKAAGVQLLIGYRMHFEANTLDIVKKQRFATVCLSLYYTLPTRVVVSAPSARNGLISRIAISARRKVQGGCICICIIIWRDVLGDDITCSMTLREVDAASRKAHAPNCFHVHAAAHAHDRDCTERRII